MAHIVIPGLVCSAALLLAMMTAVVTGAARLQKIRGAVLGAAAALGLLFYCGAFLTPARSLASAAGAVLRGVLSTCVMFMGRSDYAAAAAAAPWFSESAPLQALFWLFHVGAFFVSASAMLSTLGKKFVQSLRLYARRADALYLFYGLHEQSLALGQDLQQSGGGKFIYIAPGSSPELDSQAASFGGIVLEQAYLPNGALNGRLLDRLGFAGGGKTLTVLALDAAENVNLAIAAAAVRLFTDIKADPQSVRIVLKSRAELDFSQIETFRRKEGEPVYSIEAFCEAELSARVLIDNAPPCSVLTFDENGRALEDFTALILGFGQVGQHALRQLVMNGQFVGSHFSAVAVDSKMSGISGQFRRRYAGMSEYDIRLLALDTREEAFYQLLDELMPKLQYVVVALGTDEANYEATADLEQYLKRQGLREHPAIMVNVCNKKYAARTRENIRFFDTRPILYTGKLLIRRQLDSLAEAVNYTYAENNPGHGSPREEWSRLSYFSRESSRASAAFIPAMLRLAGLTEQEAADGTAYRRRIDGELLEVLAQTEHLRWNAFHHAMGYVAMTREEILARRQAGLTPIQKDTVHLRHACLIPWEALDGLSDWIGRLQGKPVDYKAMDRDNVAQIPRTLSLWNKTAK